MGILKLKYKKGHLEEKVSEELKKDERFDGIRKEADKILEAMVKGATLDYAPELGRKGKVVLMINRDKKEWEKVPVADFLVLREKGLIIKSRNTLYYHAKFKVSYDNPIEVYTISPDGKSYLETIK